MKKEFIIAAVVVVISMFLVTYVGYRCGVASATHHETSRDTTTYIDTIPYYMPLPKDSAVVRYVTRVLRVAGHEVPPTSPVGHQTGGTAQGGSLPRTTVAYMKADGLADGNDGVNGSNGLDGLNGLDGCDGGDTFLLPDYAQIPDENIRVGFSSDSIPVEIPIIQKRYESEDYLAYVSGYEPSLDSIFVFPKTTVIRERIYKPPNKWHIGITGGYGYGFTSKQAEPYIGIGITYSVFSF